MLGLGVRVRVRVRVRVARAREELGRLEELLAVDGLPPATPQGCVQGAQGCRRGHEAAVVEGLGLGLG